MTRRLRGFTIAEIILAMFIIVMGFLAVARILPGGHKGGTADKNRLIALRIARNVIDLVRSAPFGDPTRSAPYGALTTTLEGPVPLVGESLEGNKLGMEFAVEKVTVTIPPAGGVGGPIGYGTVSVTVTWHQSGGQTNSAGNNSLTVTGGIFREP